MPLKILHGVALKGIPLHVLQVYYSQVSDLSPLQGMPLTNLSCFTTQVSDLSPLEDCKNLKILNVKQNKVTPALQKALPNCKIEWDDPAK